jgi:hypothetical protein
MADLQSTRRTRSHVWLAMVVVIVGTVFGLWLFLSGPNIAKYAPVIADLASGRLNDDGSGRIDLAKSFPGLTPQDEIFITHHPDGSFVVLFPNYYAKGPVIAGFMYASRSLTDQDTRSRQLGVGSEQQIITVGQWRKLVINRKLDGHWYRVSYGMQ